jgi:hypothetical protein
VGQSYKILQAFNTLLRELTFDGIDKSSIRVMELPKADGQLEIAPCIAICPHGEYPTLPWSFSELIDTDGVEVCLIDSTLGQLGTDQEKRQGWQEAVTTKILMADAEDDFRKSLPGVSRLFSIDSVPSAVFDRSKLSLLYSYSSVLFKVQTTT